MLPKVAGYLWYLLFVHHERRRSASCDVDARHSSCRVARIARPDTCMEGGFKGRGI
jgi:hypothetical protein